jgi:hypothetical protein
MGTTSSFFNKSNRVLTIRSKDTKQNDENDNSECCSVRNESVHMLSQADGKFLESFKINPKEIIANQSLGGLISTEFRNTMTHSGLGSPSQSAAPPTIRKIPSISVAVVGENRRVKSFDIQPESYNNQVCFQLVSPLKSCKTDAQFLTKLRSSVENRRQASQRWEDMGTTGEFQGGFEFVPVALMEAKNINEGNGDDEDIEEIKI